MELADAGAGTLWLRIVIALAPPVLAAVVAGYFTLSNTVARRAERLKSLNDIRISSNINLINPDYALERIMLRELKLLDLATLPSYRWGRRFLFAAVLITVADYTLSALNFLFHFVTHPRLLIIESTSALIAVVLIVVFFVGMQGYRNVIKLRYEQGRQTLDDLAETTSKTACENDAHKAPESGAAYRQSHTETHSPD
jgi:hypothetical protein